MALGSVIQAGIPKLPRNWGPSSAGASRGWQPPILSRENQVKQAENLSFEVSFIKKERCICAFVSSVRWKSWGRESPFSISGISAVTCSVGGQAFRAGECFGESHMCLKHSEHCTYRWLRTGLKQEALRHCLNQLNVTFIKLGGKHSVTPSFALLPDCRLQRAAGAVGASRSVKQIGSGLGGWCWVRGHN